jgi:hypothetical protein
MDQYMVVYVSTECIDHIIKIRTRCGLLEKTKIIEITDEDLYLKNKLNIITENTKKNLPPYNIPQYIMSVNSRYGYMESAIGQNYFNTDYFAWVDFGAGHIVDIPTGFKIKYSKEHKIRMGWICRFKSNNFQYNHKALGGGVFAGHKEIMLEFCKLHDVEFQKLMREGYNINDDKLCFTIFEKYPQLFDIYFSSYGQLMLKINNK